MQISVAALLLLLLAPPSASAPCMRPPSSATKPPKKDGESAARAGRHLEAAGHWQRAADLYPVCMPAHAQRAEMVRRALTAFQRARGGPAPACSNPDLQAALLVRRTLTDLRTLAEQGDAQPEVQAEFSRRLADLPGPARDASLFLDAQTPPLAPDASLAAHAAGVAAFGACPTLRAALARHVLAALPSALPEAPACDATTETSRQALRDALTALERAEPTSASTTPEYLALQARLTALNSEGQAITELKVQAVAAEDPDDAASSWATRARGLPICDAYLGARHDAVLAAVAAWQAPGAHRETPGRRHTLSDQLIDDTLLAIEANYGEASRQLPAHVSLTRARAALVPPPSPKPPRPTVPSQPPPNSPAHDKPDRRANRLRTGLAISGALTGVAISVGTGLAFAARRGGPLFDKIVDSTLAAGLNPYTTQDLCSNSFHQDRGTVADACARQATARNTAIGMWGLGAATAISMVVLASLYSKAASSPSARPTLSLTPSANRWMLGVNLRF